MQDLEEQIAQITNSEDFVKLCNTLFEAEYGDDFQPIDGTQSDEGVDGYLRSQQQLFAIYCPKKPERRTGRDHARKIASDLQKAVKLNKEGVFPVRQWTFVTPRKLSVKVIRGMEAAAVSLPFSVSHKESTFLSNLLLKHRDLVPKFPFLQLPLIDEKLEPLRRPSRDDLDFLVEHNRARLRRKAFVLLRTQLCRHFTEPEIAEMLRSEGKRDIREDVPDLFSYLPHTTKIRVKDTEQGRFRWEPCSLRELLDRLRRRTPERLLALVEAPAGFGKSTFLAYVAWRVNVGRDALALPPATMLERKGDLEPTSRPALIRLLLDWLERPQQWAPAFFEVAVQLLLEQGKIVILVDGLDQVEEAATRMESYLASTSLPIRLIASCRQEIGVGETSLGWDEVIRLDKPSLEHVGTRQLPLVLRDVLRNAVGAAEIDNPFWIHVGRLLLYMERLPESDLSTGTLLNAYVRELFELGRRRTGKPQDSFSVSERQEQAIAVVQHVALVGLCLKLRNTPGVVQEVPELVVRHALATARAVSAQPADALDFASLDSHLFYRLVERGVRAGAGMFLFRHQLLQEYLAAREIARSIAQDDSPKLIASKLASAARDIIQPEVLDTRLRGDEIPERAKGLALWWLLADEMRSKVPASIIAEVVKELNARVLPVRSTDGATPETGRCLTTVLTTIRDLLCDAGIQAFCNKEAGTAPPPKDLVWTPFVEKALPPDPLGWLLWRDERQAIARQMASSLGGREPRDLAPWARLVEWEGSCLVAVDRLDQRWLLMPAGPFLSLPIWYEYGALVEVADLQCPLWVAEDPVLADDYQAFLSSAGDPDAPWWRGLPREVVAELFIEASSVRRFRPREPRPLSGRGFPAWRVGWLLARGFAGWRGHVLGGQDGIACPCRLPTALEWEKAARGICFREYPWGCRWEPKLAICALEDSPSPMKPAPVEINAGRSVFGIRGLLGNVWEWTCTKKSFGEQEGISHEDLPFGWPATARYMMETRFIACGGCYSDQWVSIDHTRVGLSYDYEGCGLRCVIDVPQ